MRKVRAEASSVFRGGEDEAQSVLSGDLDHLDRAELERLVGQSAAVQAQLQSQVKCARSAIKDSQDRAAAAEAEAVLARQAASNAMAAADEAEAARAEAEAELRACRAQLELGAGASADSSGSGSGAAAAQLEAAA